MSNRESIAMKGLLKGKVAIITGGAAGIGKATALLFAQEGAAVTIVDLDQLNGSAVMETIVNQGGKALFIHGDVSQAADCKNAIETQYSASLHLLPVQLNILSFTIAIKTYNSIIKK